MKKIHLQGSLMLWFFMASAPGLFAQPLDWGDAPDPSYPTLQANNGACHMMSPLQMGIYWDAETDGTIGMMSYGDDMNNSWADDEDGVRFLTYLVPGQNCTVEIFATAPGLLNAWIDFDFNMQWTDSYDQIFVNQPLTQGINTLSFPVSGNAMPGMMTFGRFRFSSVAGLSFTGPAPDGEVEDYNILLGSPLSNETFLDPDPSLSYAQNEISLARISGTGTSYDGWLLAAYNDSPFINGPGMGISISQDDGATWTTAQLPYPLNTVTGVQMAESFDPSIAADDLGHVFVAQIATDGNWYLSPSNGLYVYRSTNGGATWGSPVAIDERPGASSVDSNYRLNDRCQVRVDRHMNSPYHNNVYLAWIQDRGNDPTKLYSDIYFSRSADGGINFTSPVMVNSYSHNMGNMPIHDIAPDGTIYLLWIDYNVQTGGTGTFYLDRSNDGGLSWGTDIQVTTVNLPPLNLNNYTDARAKGAAILRVSPLNSSHLYIVYAADADPLDLDEADIFFIASQDAGVTWSMPVRVNDDLYAAAMNDQVLPWMEVQANGDIHIVWYDRRNDPMDLMWDVYYARSTDGGQTFGANQKVNIASFYTPAVWFSLFAYWDSWMGEYPGLAISNNTAYFAYTSRVQDQWGDVCFSKYVFTPIGKDEISGAGKSASFFSLFPNPASTVLNVVLTGPDFPEFIQAEIYSVYGQCLLKTEISGRKEFSLDISGLSSGMYWLRVQASGNSGGKKFVKY